METPVLRVMASAAAALDSGGSDGLRMVSKSLLSLIDSSDSSALSDAAASANVLSFHMPTPERVLMLLQVSSLVFVLFTGLLRRGGGGTSVEGLEPVESGFLTPPFT